MSAKLVLLSGPQAGQSLPIPGEGLSVGRQADNRLQVPGHGVSRHHKAIREGAFREDLYYRLNVITLHLPPLIRNLDLRGEIRDDPEG